MILTKNKDTGLMETVAGAGILPRIPMIEIDLTKRLAYMADGATQAPLFVPKGTVIPYDGRARGQHYTVPQDGFIIGRFNIRNLSCTYNFIIDGNVRQNMRINSLDGPIVSIFPVFVKAGSVLEWEMYNHGSSIMTSITVAESYSNISLYDYKITSIIPKTGVIED
jgi:hypothetical protein